jgi:hypothetical protein
MNTTEQNGGPGDPGNPSGNSPGGAEPGNNGNVSPDAGWTAGLQDADNRTFLAAKGWDKPNTGPDVVIRSHRELESRLGKSIVIPAADAPKEEHSKLFVALGKPAKPDGYEFKLPQGVPDNLPYDDGFATEFKGWAHEADLLPRQAQAIHDKFALRVAKQITDQQAALTKKIGDAHREIQAKWGEEGTAGYKRSLEMAARAIRNLGLEPAYKAAGLLTPDGMITDAKVAFSLADVGKAMFAEDSAHGGPGHLTANNPWADGKINLGEQGRILKENPDQARALIVAAGKDPEKELYTPKR